MFRIEKQHREGVVADSGGVGEAVGGRSFVHGIQLRGAGERRRGDHGELQAVKFYHKQCTGSLLPLCHCRIRRCDKGSGERTPMLVTNRG